MREVGGKYSKEIKEIILKYEEEGFIYFGEEKTTCEEKVEILKSILQDFSFRKLFRLF